MKAAGEEVIFFMSYMVYFKKCYPHVECRKNNINILALLYQLDYAYLQVKFCQVCYN